jgi:hypothetical protein
MNNPQSTTNPTTPTSPAAVSNRMSLNLDAKQMCNLKSVSMMEAEKEAECGNPDNKSGGVHVLIQARNMVVSARCISPEPDMLGETSEISVWNACTADRISTMRQYWQSLQ